MSLRAIVGMWGESIHTMKDETKSQSLEISH